MFPYFCIWMVADKGTVPLEGKIKALQSKASALAGADFALLASLLGKIQNSAKSATVKLTP